MRRSAWSTGILAILCMVISTAAGCIKVNPAVTNKGPVTLSEVTAASSVSATGQPLSVAEIFLASTPTVYVAAKVNDALDNTLISAKWIFLSDDTGKPINQVLYEDSATVTGTKYVAFNHKAPSGTWITGQYTVLFSINGREVSSAKFSIKAVQAANVPAPTISYFKAFPEAINLGQAVTLSWSVTDATTATLVGYGNFPAKGNNIVTPVTSQEYQLTATNAAGTTSAKLFVDVTSMMPDMPDLVITDFGVEGEKAYYKIRNIGGVEAKNSYTGLYINGMAASQSAVEIMAPNQERTYYFSGFKWTYGTQRAYKIPVRVCADDYDRIGEYNKDNNCLVLDW